MRADWVEAIYNNFHKVMVTLGKDWKNSEEKKYENAALGSSPAHDSTVFLVLPNFHSCYHNFIETRKAFYIS